MNERERNVRPVEAVKVISSREIVVKDSRNSERNSKKFTFDRTFGPEASQSDVYMSVVAPFIEEVLSGYNCTVFAYGQTGTGNSSFFAVKSNQKIVFLLISTILTYR